MKKTTDKPENTYKPLLLVRNVRYPSYQLWAIAGDVSNQETVLKVAVLYTMQWLRERFREHEIPKWLDFPSPQEYATVDISQFSNVYEKSGNTVEIIWLEDEKSWSLQLTEPDLGPNPGKDIQKRDPVPGRLFETNISYQVSKDGVLCGFRTMITEPEGTAVPCEVFRLGVIKHLKRDPLVGLKQIWELREEPHYIRTLSDARNFSKNIKRSERTLPVVIINEFLQSDTKTVPELSEKDLDAIIKNLDSGIGKRSSFEKLLQNNGVSEVTDTFNESKPILPFNLENISHYKMGYAHFFVVESSVLNEFNKACGLKLENGGVVFYPPNQAGDSVSYYSYNKVREDTFLRELEDLVQDYSLHKRFDFSHCRFAPEAYKIYREKALRNIHTEVELREHYEGVIEHNEDRYRKQLSEEESYWRSELRKVEMQLGKEKDARSRHEIDAELLREKLDRQIIETEAYVVRLKALRSRPLKLGDVCDWAEQSFSERVVVLKRARSKMKEVQNKDFDFWLLCDAIEYLVSEYWEELNGTIDENERDIRCSKHYGKRFQVTPNSETTIKAYPNEYYVQYEKESVRSSRSVPLDLHLKVGTGSRLVRVYFFYDKDVKKIVIGSMPEHLSTIGYK